MLSPTIYPSTIKPSLLSSSATLFSLSQICMTDDKPRPAHIRHGKRTSTNIH